MFRGPLCNDPVEMLPSNRCPCSQPLENEAVCSVASGSFSTLVSIAAAIAHQSHPSRHPLVDPSPPGAYQQNPSGWSERPRLLNAKARCGRRCTGLRFWLATWEEKRHQPPGATGRRRAAPTITIYAALQHSSRPAACRTGLVEEYQSSTEPRSWGRADAIRQKGGSIS